MQEGDQCFFYHSNKGLEIVGIADDDVWLHPPRILQDLRPLQPLNDVLLGNIAFAAGWSTSKSRHYGFGTEARSWLRLLREHVSADRDDLDPGPFAFAMGWAFFLSRPLALRVAYSPVASRAAAAGRAVRSPLRKGKCQPSGDSFVGRAKTDTNGGRPRPEVFRHVFVESLDPFVSGNIRCEDLDRLGIFARLDLHDGEE